MDPEASQTTPSGAGTARHTDKPTTHSSSALFQCADCKRCYSRPEHLARHVQTHTLGKRFICEVCTKAFARADLLKRHASNHASDSRKKRRPTVAASRVTRACRACASARVKCEEKKPCTRCTSRHVICEYDGTSHVIHSAASQAECLQSSSNAEDQGPATSVQRGDSPNLDMPDRPDKEPTPQSMMNQGLSEGFTPSVNYDEMFDFANVPFSDFLRDVMTQEPFDASRGLDEPQGLAVLNFNDNTNLALSDTDLGLLDFYNGEGFMENFDFSFPEQPKASAPTLESSKLPAIHHRLAKMWMEWKWMPNKEDHSSCDELNLPVPSSEMTSSQFKETRRKLDRIIDDEVEPSGRDKILSCVLSTVSHKEMIRASSSFPSAELMDTFFQTFLASHHCQTSVFLHQGILTGCLNSQLPVWLTITVGAGAILAPVPSIRRFGFALQEAVRVAIARLFEENNLWVRDLQCLQAFVLQLDVGLWSGNQRKMEIAESFSQTIVTMLRYGNKFRSSTYHPITVNADDYGPELAEKWKAWVVQESWKRLAFHIFVRDAPMSMTSLSNVITSYAEFTLPLPEPRDIWLAKTAEEWKALRLSKGNENRKLPSLGDLLRDITCLLDFRDSLDLPLVSAIYLSALWAMIREHQQLKIVHRSSPDQNNNTTLLLASRHTELVQTLHRFRLLSQEHQITSTPENLLLHLLLMYLHVPLADLEVFAGKDGEEEARKIYPSLQTWAASHEAREALWQAGQVMRYASGFEKKHLKDFYAVTVLHASFTIWAYGVLTNWMKKSSPAPRNTAMQIPSSDVILLDGEESLDTQRFISVGKGLPALQRRSSGGEVSVVTLEDTRGCMDITHDVLRYNCGSEGDTLPSNLVDNLCHVIKQLGSAAWAVGL